MHHLGHPTGFRWKGEDSHVVIGDNNTIREHVIINRSIHKDGETRIGNDTFIMAQSHIAHDSLIGNSVRDRQFGQGRGRVPYRRLLDTLIMRARA